MKSKKKTTAIKKKKRKTIEKKQPKLLNLGVCKQTTNEEPDETKETIQ